MTDETAIVFPSNQLALGRNLSPKRTHANVLMTLDAVGDRIRFEEFSRRVVVTGMPPAAGHFPEGEWTDDHTTEFTAMLERNGLEVSTAVVDRALAAHAKRRGYNVLTDWLAQCAEGWDGTPRVDQAMATYWGAPDNDASRAVSRVTLLSMAARGVKPGCKVDTCPVLIGGQGIGKSRSLRALAGEAWFSDSPLPIGDKDAMQNLGGIWLWELGENVGFSKRDRNAVKAFLSSAEDTYRASYGRHAERVPRQTCFAVTTNDEQTLTDPTGARRFLPVHVGRIDVDGIARDREQLLGEAAVRVECQGEHWWPTPEEDAALQDAREGATESDPWEDPLAAWLDKRGDEPFTMATCLSDALLVDTERQDKRAQVRVADVLRRLGCERWRDKSRKGRGKRDVWKWRRTRPSFR